MSTITPSTNLRDDACQVAIDALRVTVGDISTSVHVHSMFEDLERRGRLVRLLGHPGSADARHPDSIVPGPLTPDWLTYLAEVAAEMEELCTDMLEDLLRIHARRGSSAEADKETERLRLGVAQARGASSYVKFMTAMAEPA